MAGFDVLFHVLERDRELVPVLLAGIRRRAKLAGVKVSTQSGVERTFIEFDGNGYGIDILLVQLARDLPTLAEGADLGRRSPTGRRKLAAGLVDILWRYRNMMYERYPEDFVPTLRAKAKPIAGVVHDIFPRFGMPELQERLFVTMDMLSLWHLDSVEAPVLIEELHTASELLLKASLESRTDDLTYAALVGKALEAHVIDLQACETLISLKNHRRSVKHDGATGADAWLEENFWDTVRVLERLSLSAGRGS